MLLLANSIPPRIESDIIELASAVQKIFIDINQKYEIICTHLSSLSCFCIFKFPQFDACIYICGLHQGFILFYYELILDYTHFFSHGICDLELYRIIVQ